MPIRYKTGNKATLTASGLTFAAHIREIDAGEWSIGTRDVSVLADEDFGRVDPEDLATPNEISGTLLFDDTVSPPYPGADIGTATLTLPGGGILAGDAFFTRFKFPVLANDQTMESEFTLQMNGENLTFTPGT
jgi:hypothetical protein